MLFLALKEVITIKKILFGITSLTLGGAERVLVDISNKLSEKYDITIFSIYDNGELKNDLNKNVKFKALYNCRYDELTKLQKMWIPIKILLFSKIIYNKKIKQNYDTEIAFLEGPITRLFSTKNKDVHKIAWIHNDIEKVFGNDLKSKIKKYIDKKIYKKYNDLVFVSQDNMEKFQNIYNDLNTENMHVIYNYIDKDLVIKKSNYNIKVEFDYNSINFLTVCRLVKQKAIDRFSSFGMYPEFPDANLIIELLYNGFKIEEIPVKMRLREYGESMHGGILKPIKYMISILYTICIIILRNAFRRRGAK